MPQILPPGEYRDRADASPGGITEVVLERLAEAATATLGGQPSVRVGTDLVSIEEFSLSIERFGDRYLRHVFTPHELEFCGDLPIVSASRLAARFAAKEATIKVLRPDDIRVDWRSIEVHREGSGACGLRLSDSAAELARSAGISSLAVSLTHEREYAAAVVVATCEAIG